MISNSMVRLPNVVISDIELMNFNTILKTWPSKN